MDTNQIILLAVIVIAAILVLKIKISSTEEKRKVYKNNTYHYELKPLVMTNTEADFFRRLNEVVSERYFVFPQVHLSALFDHRVKGQEWKYAFSHINGKSVDYVLCDKQSLQPMYAIELDDFTHQYRDRIERDSEVERIFKLTQLPLVRFKNKDVTQSEIIHALTAANSKVR
jgi:very-short-patch-repair endonuclease